jgi:hypothetical protein
MGDLSIDTGDLHFTARFEADAPRTVEAIRGLLPLRSQFIHVRWSGEGVWMQLEDWRAECGFENHTSHPAPGQILLYPGRYSVTEIIMAYGPCEFRSKVGQLAGNHFATIVEDNAWRDRLLELGRRCLWEGAQPLFVLET